MKEAMEEGSQLLHAAPAQLQVTNSRVSQEGPNLSVVVAGKQSTFEIVLGADWIKIAKRSAQGFSDQAKSLR
jgi:hypothetical protein